MQTLDAILPHAITAVVAFVLGLVGYWVKSKIDYRREIRKSESVKRNDFIDALMNLQNDLWHCVERIEERNSKVHRQRALKLSKEIRPLSRDPRGLSPEIVEILIGFVRTETEYLENYLAKKKIRGKKIYEEVALRNFEGGFIIAQQFIGRIPRI